ncbi:hypothetical protein FJTKL_04853 [Diaporthe vaccinii]|uniref:Uncharacterized protein n=1 Tax=Diaporthe vaccinii TaxID=105482 RepID=A0ABR4DS81_9PEZI
MNVCVRAGKLGERALLSWLGLGKDAGAKLAATAIRGLQFLRLVCPKPKSLGCSTVPVVLRQTSDKQLWQTNSGGVRARTGPASPSPLHHTTPPFSRTGAEEAGRAISKTPLFSKD